MIAETNIKIKCDNPLQVAKAQDNLQKLVDRLGAKGINKLMAMYESPSTKIAVNGFFLMNGI